MKYKLIYITLFFIIFNLLLSINLFSQNYFNDSSMVYIENGYFFRENNKGGDKHFKQKVSITEFYLSKYEVTNIEYCNYLNKAKLTKSTINKYINLKGKTSYIFLEDTIYKVKYGYKKYPVSFVSWSGANAYCKFYNLRLPTEAEWEYVAKKDNNFFKKIFKKQYKYSGSNDAKKVAWYRENSENSVHKIGLKHSNKLGIFDMSGNLDEWCNDWYSSDYEKGNKIKNPQGASKGVFKVIRGGSWYNSEKMIRITNRRAISPKLKKATIGFRVAKDIEVFCPANSK